MQESSIIEAVEKQLQGTVPPPQQQPHTPQMGKKPQMGSTVVAQQHQQQQQQQIEQQAITPLSGEKRRKLLFNLIKLDCLRAKVENFLI